MSAQPALFNDRVPARRKSAACWSPDENQFAAWLMQQWNDTIGRVGQRVYDKRRNRFAAIDLYRRMWQPSEAREKMNLPPRQLFSNEAIRAALEAYAACEHNVRLRSWKSFHDFCTEGEELIDKHLKRIDWNEPAPRDPKREAAGKVIDGCPYIDMAVRATKANWSLGEYIDAEAARYLKAKMRSEDERGRILRAINAVASKLQHLRSRPMDEQRDLWKRAAEVFADWTGRPMGRSLSDTNAGRAIALALVDRDDIDQESKEPAQS